jgi:hypothetical protein
MIFLASIGDLIPAGLSKVNGVVRAAQHTIEHYAAEAVGRHCDHHGSLKSLISTFCTPRAA